MGCKYCSSGLGVSCEGPLGLDDVEVGCSCSCHECSECGSAYCVNVGGPDPCRVEEDNRAEDYERDLENWRPVYSGEWEDLDE